MFDWSSGKAYYRTGIFPDDSSAIDFVLDTNVVKRIYDAWDESVYGELVDYGGGVKAITTRMLHLAGEEFLTGIKNIGAVRAEQILKEVELALGEVPYGSGV